MDKEEKIKKDLNKCWKKEHDRIYKFNNKTIKFGSGTGKRLDHIITENEIAAHPDDVWETIEEFGIPKDDMKALLPTFSEIFEVYSAIKAYRVSVRYLKLLKDRMGGNQHV